jgi:hypothetical protein
MPAPAIFEPSAGSFILRIASSRFLLVPHLSVGGHRFLQKISSNFFKDFELNPKFFEKNRIEDRHF